MSIKFSLGYSLVARASCRCRLSTNVAPSTVDKSLLAKLRQKTGLPFIHCKNALVKFNNDMPQATTWLLEEAKRQGWAKAAQVSHRSMSQGLIGIAVQDKVAAMIEMNCETDFVSRNEKFRHLVATVATACLERNKDSQQQKIALSGDKLSHLTSLSGVPLAELLAQEIGLVGENMALRRAVILRAPPGGHIAAHVHSSAMNPIKRDNCIMGRFGSLVSFTQTAASEGMKHHMKAETLGKLLCQHVVGLNPSSIGLAGEEGEVEREQRMREEEERRVEAERKAVEQREREAERKKQELERREESEATESESTASDEEESDVEEESIARYNVNEKRMLHQNFLFDTTMTVEEMLIGNGAQITDFARFESGEELASDKEGQ